MTSIYHFFRLIRSINLMVIGLTMVVVYIFINQIDIVSKGVQELNNLNFLLLIVSTLLIAAAGNMINDYFDVKADRINKPNRLIIGKYIKRRWAMVLHWSFNVLGLCIALYVGYKLQNVWVPLIAFFSINALWFYSAYFKRKPLIGNLIVAFLLGVIPIHVLLFSKPIQAVDVPINDVVFSLDKTFLIAVVLFVAGLAFCQNLTRELIKDIQDVRGDVRLGAKTFPIKFGIKKTKLIIGVIVVLTLLLMTYFASYIALFEAEQSLLHSPHILDVNMTFFNPMFYYFLVLSAVLFLLSSVIALAFNKRKTYKISSVILKLAMVTGLLTPLFLI